MATNDNAKKYSVAISYQNSLGWIDYDGDKKEAEVHLGDETGKKRTEDYLHETHELGVPHKTLMDFTRVTVDPLADVASFQLALTRLWNQTNVQVDWSRPVSYVKEHPHY
ncbi:MAG: hypothetical protein SOV43_09035 [Selenomonadaceae bacterium]|nr:hypothetical protein [Selenomonadaceae bacterium]MDY2686298.1 hypothetical protein [Selenomonadaceae bacterium]